MKRILFTSDPHCGHLVGLTPPSWQISADRPHAEKFAAVERACWTWFSKKINALRPFHVHACLGDIVDGTGLRSGGSELIVVDRNQQVEIALEVFDFIRAPVNIVCKGTPYHTGPVEEMETTLEMSLRDRPWCKVVKTGDHEWMDVNGVVFDLKHHIGGSQIPHGRWTALARDETWNAIWAESGAAPRSDYLLRGHVHYLVEGHRYVGNRRRTFSTCPALQGLGTRFGKKKCSGTVDYGFMWCDIDDKGAVQWHEEIMPVTAQRATALVV